VDASLPTGKKHRLLNVTDLNRRLSGSEALSNRDGSSDGYVGKCLFNTKRRKVCGTPLKAMRHQRVKKCEAGQTVASQP
jgi:hypothetical protein